MGTPAGEMHCSFLPCSGFLAKEAVSSVQWDCVKSLLPPAAAEYSSERHVIFTISLREIVKMTCLSKHHSARSAVKKLFTQTLKILFGAKH
jgi:hypothetical protein